MIRAKVCDLLKIQYPVFGGAMAYISDGTLAGALSKAGGFGIIACLGHTANSLRDEIRKARILTKNPIGVNLMIKSPDIEDYIRVISEENIEGVTTGAGNPLPIMPRLKEAGVRVFPVVPNQKLAVRMQENGADGVIVEGMEAGGHIGDMTTMALVPQVADAVSIPVLAAGGIGDGRGLAAALMLGAGGVQIGTRLMTVKECRIHDKAKERLMEADGSETLHLGKGTSHSVRVLKSELTEKLAAMELAGADSKEKEELQQGSYQKAVDEGEMTGGYLPIGQIVGLLKKQDTADDMMQELIKEAEAALEKGKALLNCGP